MENGEAVLFLERSKKLEQLKLPYSLFYRSLIFAIDELQLEGLSHFLLCGHDELPNPTRFLDNQTFPFIPS